MNNQKTKLMLVDDNKLMRVGLKTLFDDSDDFLVVAEAQYGKEAIHKAESIKPGIILMDIVLPDISGIKASAQILKNNPYTKIVIITSNLTEEFLYNSIRIGAFAVVCKDINTDFLMFIIKSVNQGAIWLDPKAAKIIMGNSCDNFSLKRNNRNDFKSTHNNLTSREYEVLKLIVDGKSNQDIANILCISNHTAKAHVCNVIQKLLVDDRTQAAVKALREGLV